jgi:putative aldouronate transport system permease protein
MFGMVLAFKDYKFNLGILGSEWNGFQNFRFFFESDAALRVTFNTLAYNLVFIVIGLFINIIVALLLNEIKNKNSIKIFQTTMFFPYFMSWVVVAFIVYSFLSPSYGIINKFVLEIGGEKTNWYFKAEVWPYILTLANTWKWLGYGVLINYAVLIGIDKSYYEAAEIDGANKFQMAIKISLPMLVPVILIQFILNMGRIFNADFGLFYQIPQNSPLLYKTTDVIETYVFRSLMDMHDIGMGTAVGLYKSVCGLVIVLLTNGIIKRVRPENALF